VVSKWVGVIEVGLGIGMGREGLVSVIGRRLNGVTTAVLLKDTFSEEIDSLFQRKFDLKAPRSVICRPPGPGPPVRLV
jgi:hypothetical protein